MKAYSDISSLKALAEELDENHDVFHRKPSDISGRIVQLWHADLDSFDEGSLGALAAGEIGADSPLVWRAALESVAKTGAARTSSGTSFTLDWRRCAFRRGHKGLFGDA